MIPGVISALAQEFAASYASGTPIASPPSTRDAAFDMTAAYAVEAELVKIARASGRKTAGRKVGFANKAMWRILKLETLVWAHMYDDTVRYAVDGNASLALGHRYSPRIEPEIVFKLEAPLGAGVPDATAALSAVEWLAVGFEVNDCLFPDWKFQPADFVAACGLHTALIVGTPMPVTSGNLPALVDALPRLSVRLSRDGGLVEEGTGKNALRSPALCLAELAGAIARQSGAAPLSAGELISTGTLTAAHPIAVGQEWRAEIDGLALSPLTLTLS